MQRKKNTKKKHHLCWFFRWIPQRIYGKRQNKERAREKKKKQSNPRTLLLLIAIRECVAVTTECYKSSKGHFTRWKAQWYRLILKKTQTHPHNAFWSVPTSSTIRLLIIRKYVYFKLFLFLSEFPSFHNGVFNQHCLYHLKMKHCIHTKAILEWQKY